MPRRDGTGPMGLRALSGRGLGICTGTNVVKYGAGLGLGLLGLGLSCRRGFGRNFRASSTRSITQKELLLEQKELLEARMNDISKQLENL